MNKGQRNSQTPCNRPKEPYLAKRDSVTSKTALHPSPCTLNFQASQIIDIKRSNFLGQSKKQVSTKKSSNFQSQTLLKFQVQFIGTSSNKGITKKVWVDDLDELKGDKIQLLQKFRASISAKSNSDPNNKLICSSRLAMLDEYINLSGLTPEQISKIRSNGDDTISNKQLVDSENIGNEGSNVLGSLMDKEDSCWKSPVKLIGVSTKFGNGIGKKENADSNNEGEDDSDCMSSDDGSLDSNGNELSYDEPITKKAELRKPKGGKSVAKPQTTNARKSVVKCTSHEARKTVGASRRKKDVAEKVEVFKRLKTNTLNTVIKETTQELEERANYVLNIVMVDKILQIKKKYINHDNICSKMACNDLEKLKEVISSILNDINKIGH